jgi:Zn-finger nucleic acid-binding protein
MTLPQCPSCREKMSATEYARYGAYACFYCEGIWLPATAIEKLLALMPYSFPLSRLAQASPEEVLAAPDLICPTCGTARFRHFTKEEVEINLCSDCAGMFFPKGAFSRAFPNATPDDFSLDPVGGVIAGETIFWAAVLFFAGLR